VLTARLLRALFLNAGNSERDRFAEFGSVNGVVHDEANDQLAAFALDGVVETEAGA